MVHHLVHLLVGVLGIAAYRAFDTARLYARGLAIVYGVLTVMGLISAANLYTMFGLTPLFSHYVWLHAGTAIIAAYLGGARSMTELRPWDGRSTHGTDRVRSGKQLTGHDRIEPFLRTLLK